MGTQQGMWKRLEGRCAVLAEKFKERSLIPLNILAAFSRYPALLRNYSLINLYIFLFELCRHFFVNCFYILLFTVVPVPGCFGDTCSRFYRHPRHSPALMQIFRTFENMYMLLILHQNRPQAWVAVSKKSPVVWRDKQIPCNRRVSERTLWDETMNSCSV